MRGAADVAFSTEDMADFLQSVLVDKTLLGHDALMQMKGGLLTDDLPLGKVHFGLGLVKVAVTDGHTLIGFTGGALATSSSTGLDVTTGAILSIGATLAKVDTGAGGLALITALQQASLWQPMADDGGALSVTSASAVDL